MVERGIDRPDDREPPLTDRERRMLREIIERDGKARWLASSVRAWGAWAAALIIAVIALSDTIKKVFKGWLA